MVYIILFLVVLLVSCFLLYRKKTSKQAAPVIDYPALLSEHVDYYRKLDNQNRERFVKLVHEFLDSVRIEGVGVIITNLDRVLIASSAVIPIFGFPGWKYHNLTNIILYPDTFDKAFQFEGENRNIMGMVGSGYMNGQMLLSRTALLKGFSASSGKENAAIHEFVHLLDKSDGVTDGIPESLMAHEYTIPWLKMMDQEMHRIQTGKSDINPYALTNEAEFLAVASEYFFEKPAQLKAKHPELYNQLSLIFAQKLTK